MVLDIVVEAKLIIFINDLKECKRWRVVLETLKQRLTYKNPKFLENEKYGYSNYNVSKYLTSYEIVSGKFIISRGALNKVKKHLAKFSIKVREIDRTLVCETVSFNQSNTIKRDDQKLFIEKLMCHTIGCGQGYASFGKTLTMLEVIKELKQPALVLVHTTFIQEQWIKEAVDPDKFNLDPKDIGGVGGIFGSKKEFDIHFKGQKYERRRYRKLNICLYHSLISEDHQDFFKDRIGILVFDEGQKTPIEGVQLVSNNFRARYRYAVSADFKRKDGKEFLTFDTFGPVRHIAVEKNSDSKILADINLVGSPYYDEDYSEVGYTEFITRMSKNKERNILICKRALLAARDDRMVAIFVERKEQAAVLAKMLSKFRVDMLLGSVNKKEIREDETLPSSVKRILLAYDSKTAYTRIEKLGNKKMLDFIIGTQKMEVGLNIRPFEHGIITAPVGKNTERIRQIKGRLERTFSKEQEKYFGRKKRIPTLDVIVDYKIRMSQEGADNIKEVWKSNVNIVRTKKKRKTILRKGEKNGSA